MKKKSILLSKLSVSKYVVSRLNSSVDDAAKDKNQTDDTTTIWCKGLAALTL